MAPADKKGEGKARQPLSRSPCDPAGARPKGAGWSDKGNGTLERLRAGSWGPRPNAPSVGARPSRAEPYPHYVSIKPHGSAERLDPTRMVDERQRRHRPHGAGSAYGLLRTWLSALADKKARWWRSHGRTPLLERGRGRQGGGRSSSRRRATIGSASSGSAETEPEAPARTTLPIDKLQRSGSERSKAQGQSPEP